jgi:hypothetical protein
VYDLVVDSHKTKKQAAKQQQTRASAICSQKKGLALLGRQAKKQHQN